MAAAWAAVACGPVALALTWTGSPAPPSPPAVRPIVETGTGPAGFAQLYLTAYLPAGTGAEDTLRRFYPGLTTLTRRANTRAAASTPVLLGTVQVRPGYWSITLGTEVLERRPTPNSTWTSSGLHCFRVAVASDDSASYAAVELPQEVACPSPRDAPRLGYDTSVGLSGPLADTTVRFLAAYLTGQGELSRYAAPGHVIRPATSTAYTAVRLMSLAARTGDHSVPATVPGDGTQVEVLADVEASDSTGEPAALSYPLTLRARAGRWEVVAVDPAPVLASTTVVRRTNAAPAETQPASSSGLPTDQPAPAPSPSP